MKEKDLKLFGFFMFLSCLITLGVCYGGWAVLLGFFTLVGYNMHNKENP